jgi:hypothetical protein
MFPIGRRFSIHFSDSERKREYLGPGAGLLWDSAPEKLLRFGSEGQRPFNGRVGAGWHGMHKLVDYICANPRVSVKFVMFSRLGWLSLLSWTMISASGDEAVAQSSVSIYEGPPVLTASIYARNSAKLLFKFKRTVSCSGAKVSVMREYSYPDGRLAAREQVAYEGNVLRSYRLEELQIGSSGVATLGRDPRDPAKTLVNVEYSKDTGSRARARNETTESGVLVNDMVGAFIASNYERLQNGAKVNCRYLVISRRETVGLSFIKERETSWHGRDVIVLRMQPTSRLISVLVDPLYFVVEKASPHRVLQYVGLTTPKVGESGHWKDLEATTVFDW